MAERLVEILVPREQAVRIGRALEGNEQTWSWSQSAEDQTVFKLLVEAQDVEELLDPIQPIVAATPGCRVLVLPVEARFPKRAEPEAAAGAAVDKPKPKKRISREEIYEDVRGFAKLDSIYITMVVLSTIVAAGGLAKDSAALLIGAMVIAPLLGPNMALTLATTLGDSELGSRALKTTATGFVVAVTVTLLSGLFWRIDPTAAEVISRTRVDFGDVVIALVTGVAGALSVTTAAVSTLVGVMVAAALLPPLVVACALLATGEYALAGNAFLLLASNVICVNLAGVATFYLQGVRPRTWWEGDRAERATRNALFVWAILFLTVVALVLFAQLAG